MKWSKKRNINFFIDDWLHNIHDIKEKNKNIKLFVLDKPWNKEREIARLKEKWKEIKESDFIRIKNIKEIKKYI